MSLRCTELGVHLSRGACGPATKDFCPTASASILIHACGQATATFCPTASASGMLQTAVEIDFAPLRAQMRKVLGH
jgi:hypothetical protein